MGHKTSIFQETYLSLPQETKLLAKWSRIRVIRDLVNKEIETLRSASLVGASLQAQVQLRLGQHDWALLSSLEDDVKFVFITSKVELLTHDSPEAEPEITVSPSPDVKCERCWHYQADVGADTAHPTLCLRCSHNLFGAGEKRLFA